MRVYHRLKIFGGVVLLLGLVVALFSYPGEMHVDWLGYRLQVSVAVFLGILLLCGFVLSVFVKTLKMILNIPLYVWRYHQKKKHLSAENALIEGIVAIASGEFVTAEKCAQLAMRDLPKNLLGQVIAAQAAFMKGNTDEAVRCFQNLQQTKETSFLGFRGEAIQAIRQGNWAVAQKALQQAIKARPHSPWALQQLLEADLRLGSYDQSRDLLKRLQKDGVITKSQHNRHRALIYWLKAQKAGHEQDPSFQSYLKKAYAYAPDLVEVVCALALSKIKTGHNSRAKKIIAKSWFIQPHMRLVEVYKQALGQVSPIDLYRSLKDLPVERADAFDVHLLLAEAALEAKLWGQARQHLQSAHTFRQTRQSCQLFAALLRGEDPYDEEKEKLWDQKAFYAESDRQWVCQQCQGKSAQWDVFCGTCGALDSLNWSFPEMTPTVALLPYFL